MLRLITCLTLAATLAPAFAADVYKCTDANGRTEFSQQPCGKDASVVTVREPSRMDAYEGASVPRSIYRSSAAPRASSGSSEPIRYDLQSQKRKVELDAAQGKVTPGMSAAQLDRANRREGAKIDRVQTERGTTEYRHYKDKLVVVRDGKVSSVVE